MVMLGHLLSKYLSRKILESARNNRKPHGTRDESGTTVRLTDTLVSRIGVFVIAMFPLGWAITVWILPFTPTRTVSLLDISVMRVVAVPVGALGIWLLMDIFNSCILVNEAGITRQNFFRRRMLLKWAEIKRVEFEGDGRFWLVDRMERRMKVPLSYNGLADFNEFAQRFMDVKLAKEVGGRVVEYDAELLTAKTLGN
jgi:hypothetical protein